jgi:serine/threonine protein kinase
MGLSAWRPERSGNGPDPALDAWCAGVTRRLAALGYDTPRQVARGNVAVLYVATSPSGARVAIRIPDPFRAKAREGASLGRWLALKLAVAMLPRHPNLVRFHAAGHLRVNGATGAAARVLYTVMDYVDGAPLLEYLASESFRAGGMARASGIVLDVLAGWSALYRRGLRKGDLSPRNVMVEGETGRAVLVDLHLSSRFLRPAVGVRKFRGTLRALLTGEYEDLRDPYPPVPIADALACWCPAGADPATRRALEDWIAFDAALGEGGRLEGAAPRALLVTARAIASRHAVAVGTPGLPSRPTYPRES